MPKVLDKDRVQRALDEAARKARAGEARSGRFILGRDASSGRFMTVREVSPNDGDRRKRRQTKN